MLLNALFPTRDIGTDPAKIRDWAQAAENFDAAARLDPGNEKIRQFAAAARARAQEMK